MWGRVMFFVLFLRMQSENHEFSESVHENQPTWMPVNILCHPVMFGSDVELAVQPTFVCISIESPTKEANSNAVRTEIERGMPPANA